MSLAGFGGAAVAAILSGSTSLRFRRSVNSLPRLGCDCALDAITSKKEKCA